MSSKIPCPHLEVSGAAWTPEIHKANVIALIPSLHIPFHSKRLIKLTLAAIAYQRPDLVIQTGPMFARETLATLHCSAPLTPEECNLARRDFLEPLAECHQGPLLINGRRAAISPVSRQGVSMDDLAEHPRFRQSPSSRTTSASPTTSRSTHPTRGYQATTR